MAFIIPRFSYGDELGKGLGAGVSQAAQHLLESKMQQLATQRDQTNAYKFGTSIGLDEKTARAFSMLDPKSRQDVASNVFIGQLGQQGQQQPLSEQFNVPQNTPEESIARMTESFKPQKTYNQQLYEDLGFIPKKKFLNF